MTFVVSVKSDKRDILRAITHVDGTARIQSVSKIYNPEFWNLIQTFGKLTGTSVILNTSLNNNYEPIVESINEAITLLLTTEINVLIIGNYLVRKKLNVLEIKKMINSLYISFPLNKKLVIRFSKNIKKNSENTYEYFIESDYLVLFFGQTSIKISEILYKVLSSDSAEVKNYMTS